MEENIEFEKEQMDEEGNLVGYIEKKEKMAVTEKAKLGEAVVKKENSKQEREMAQEEIIDLEDELEALEKEIQQMDEDLVNEKVNEIQLQQEVTDKIEEASKSKEELRDIKSNFISENDRMELKLAEAEKELEEESHEMMQDQLRIHLIKESPFCTVLVKPTSETSQFALKVTDSTQPEIDMLENKEVFYNQLVCMDKCSMTFDHMVTPEMIKYFTIQEESKEELKISASVEYLVKHMQTLLSFIMREEREFLPAVSDQFSADQRKIMKEAPFRHRKLMLIFYCFDDINHLKEILTVLLSSINNKTCNPNLADLGGFIDISLTHPSKKLDCELLVRICDTSEDLTKLIKEAKKDKKMLLSVYSQADKSQSSEHLVSLFNIQKTKTT